jgi:hypothetical protein
LSDTQKGPGRARQKSMALISHSAKAEIHLDSQGKTRPAALVKLMA